MLRIRVKLCRGSACVEALAIANSGFVGAEPEALVPPRVSEALFDPSPQVELVERVLADGSRALLPRALEAVEVYAVEEDRVVGSGEGPRVYRGEVRAPQRQAPREARHRDHRRGRGALVLQGRARAQNAPRALSYPSPSEYSARYLSLLSSHW